MKKSQKVSLLLVAALAMAPVLGIAEIGSSSYPFVTHNADDGWWYVDAHMGSTILVPTADSGSSYEAVVISPPQYFSLNRLSKDLVTKFVRPILLGHKAKKLAYMIPKRIFASAQIPAGAKVSLYKQYRNALAAAGISGVTVTLVEQK